MTHKRLRTRHKRQVIPYDYLNHLFLTWHRVYKTYHFQALTQSRHVLELHVHIGECLIGGEVQFRLRVLKAQLATLLDEVVHVGVVFCS